MPCNLAFETQLQMHQSILAAMQSKLDRGIHCHRLALSLILAIFRYNQGSTFKVTRLHIRSI
jgi:hypothetical protein